MIKNVFKNPMYQFLTYRSATIDELEDKLYAEKLKIKQTVEDMDNTIHASAL